MALHPCVIQGWINHQTSNQSRMNSYLILKRYYELRDYLVSVRDVKQRQILTKYRISDHNLAVETGGHRWTCLPTEAKINLFAVMSAVKIKHFYSACKSSRWEKIIHQFCSQHIVWKASKHLLPCTIFTELLWIICGVPSFHRLFFFVDFVSKIQSKEEAEVELALTPHVSRKHACGSQPPL